MYYPDYLIHYNKNHSAKTVSLLLVTEMEMESLMIMLIDQKNPER